LNLTENVRGSGCVVFIHQMSEKNGLNFT